MMHRSQPPVHPKSATEGGAGEGKGWLQASCQRVEQGWLGLCIGHVTERVKEEEGGGLIQCHHVIPPNSMSNPLGL